MLNSVVFFSHTYKNNSIFKVGSHHLAEQFSCMGIDVKYFSTPISPLHILVDRKKFYDVLRLTSVDGCPENKISEYGLIHAVPYLPNMPGLYYRIRNYLDVNKFKKKYGKIKTDLLLIDQPNMFHLIQCINAKKIIYRPTDIYWKFHTDTALRQIELQVCKKADGIVATSDPVLTHIKDLCGDSMKCKPNIVIQNGVNYIKFSTECAVPNLLKSIRKPIAIYVGSLDHRFDLDLLYNVVKLCKDINFVIIGPSERAIISRFENISNIVFGGAIDYENIAAFMQHSDVGIMTLKKNELNDGRSPMKFYEYMACGIPIVSTGLQEMKKRKCQGVFFADDAVGFSRILQETVKQGYDKYQLQNYAKEQDWKNKAEEILRFYTSL